MDATDVLVRDDAEVVESPRVQRGKRAATPRNGDAVDAENTRVPSVPITDDHRARLADLAERMHPQEGRSISMAQAAEMALEVGLRHLTEVRVQTIADIIDQRTTDNTDRRV